MATWTIARFARAGIAALMGLLLLSSVGASAGAATVIVVRSDGSASVRSEGGEAIILPSGCVAALDRRLPPLTEPDAVRDAVAGIVSQWAPADGPMAGAIAAYALTLVPEGLGGAVIAGAQQGNPEASDDIVVAAGPAPRGTGVGGLGNLHSMGGIGGGAQEVVRSASEIR